MYGRQYHLQWIIDATVGGNALVVNDAKWQFLAFHEASTVLAVLVEVLGPLVVPVVEQLCHQ